MSSKVDLQYKQLLFVQNQEKKLDFSNFGLDLHANTILPLSGLQVAVSAEYIHYRTFLLTS